MDNWITNNLPMTLDGLIDLGDQQTIDKTTFVDFFGAVIDPLLLTQDITKILNAPIVIISSMWQDIFSRWHNDGLI